MMKHLAAAILATLPLLAACGDDDSKTTEDNGPVQAVWFTGRVYDGATGARLSSYEIELQFLDESARGKVDGDGRYVVGPLVPYHDYTVEIRAAGYRSFLSHNEFLSGEWQLNPLTGTYELVPLKGSFYYDAYLFPEALVAPATAFHVTTEAGIVEPSGLIRLTPVASSALIEDRAGVNNQIWRNDEDLQFRSAVKSFTDGEAMFEEGELVYGVEYLVTVHGVSGYQIADTYFVAGFDGDQVVTLEPFAQAPLAVVYHSAIEGRPTASGELVVVFNQPVELDPSATENYYAEWIDDAFSAVLLDSDGDGIVNTFHLDESEQIQEKGTNIALSGNVLTFTWNAASAFQTADPDDLIPQVQWNGLNRLMVRPVGANSTGMESVGGMLGSDSIDVQLVAAP